jgi:hypothetical protein
LRIDEQAVRADLLNHIVEQKISIFWIVVILVTLNIVWSAIILAKQEYLFHFSISIIYFVGFGPLFALFRFRFKKAVRSLPCLVFLALSVFIVLTAYGVSDKLMRDASDFDYFYNLLVGYLCCSIIMGQSDFKAMFYFMFPVYLAAEILINKILEKRFNNRTE